MPEPKESSLFPYQEYNPAMLGKPELEFVREHIGKTPRQAGFRDDDTHPDLMRADGSIVHSQVCSIVLRRLWEIGQAPGSGEFLHQCKLNTAKQLKADARKPELTATIGGVDYAGIHVGLEEGFTPIDRSFAVPFPGQIRGRPGFDWIADLRGEPEKPEKVEEIPEHMAPAVDEIECPWCPDLPYRKLQSVDAHVRAAHRDDKEKLKEWKKIKADFIKKRDGGTTH